MPDRPKKSMAEMRADAIAEQGGIQCPKCHCRLFSVSSTRYSNGHYRRRRTCRNCGYSISTVEIAVPKGKHF